MAAGGPLLAPTRENAAYLLVTRQQLATLVAAERVLQGHSRAHQQEPGVPSVLKGTLVWFPYLGQYRLRQVVRLTHEDPPGHLEGGAAFADAQPQQRLLVQSTVDDDPGYLAFHCGSASREDPLAPGLWEAQGSQELQAMWRHLRRHSRPPTLAEAAASAFRRRVVLDFCAAHHRIEPAHVPQLLALLSDQQGVQQQAALMEAEAWPGGPQAAAAPVAPAAACPAEAQAGPANGPAIGFLQHAAHLPGLGDVGLAADAAPSGAAQDVAPAQRSAVLAEHAGVPVDPGSDVALQQLLPSFITGQQHHLDSHRHDSVAAGGPAGVAAPNRSTEVPRQHLGQPAPQCETDSAVRQHAFIGTAEDRQKVNSRSRHGGGGPGAGEAQALQPGGHASGSAANGHSQQPSSAQPSSSQGQGRASNGQVESGRFSGERQAERRATDRQPEAEQRPGGRDSWRPDRGSSHGRAADAGGERQSSRRIAEERRAGVEWQGSRRIADERRAGDERQGSRRIAHERGAGDERQSSRMAVERGAGDERQGSRRGEDVKLRAELQAVRWHDDSARQEADGWQGRKGSGQQYADVAPSARAGHRELASTAAPARASAPLAPAAPPRTSAPGTAGQAAKGPVADGGSRKRGLSPAPAAGPGEQAAGEGSAKRRRELLVWKAQEPNPTDRPLMLPGTKIPAAAAPAASKAAAAGKGSTALSHAAAGTSSKPVAGGGARATAVNGRPLQQDAANRHRDDHHPQQQQQQFDKQRHQMQQHPPRNQQAAPAAPTLLITISNNPAPAPPLAPPLPGHANRPARFLAGPAPTMQQQPAFGVALPPGFGAASDGPIQAAGSVRQPAPLQFVSGPSLPLHLASASYDRADATAAVAGADGANGAAGYREPIPFDSSAQWQQQEQQWEEEWQPQQQQGWQQEQQQQQHYLDVVETDYDGASQRRIEYEGEWEEGPPGGLSPQQRRVEFEGQAHLQDRQHQHPADRGSFSKVDIPGAKDTQEALRLLQSAVERAVPEGEQACRLKRTVLRRMLEQLEVGYTQRTWVIFGIPFPHVGEIVVKLRQQDGQHTQQYEALGQSGNGKPLSKLFSDLAALGLVQVLKPKYGRLDALVLLPALAEYMPPVSGGERPPSSIGGSAGRDRERSPPPKRSRREQLQQPGELRLAPEVARGSAEYEEFWDPAFRLDCRIFKQLRHGAVALDEVHRRVTIPRRLDGLQNFDKFLNFIKRRPFLFEAASRSAVRLAPGAAALLHWKRDLLQLLASNPPRVEAGEVERALQRRQQALHAQHQQELEQNFTLAVRKFCGDEVWVTYPTRQQGTKTVELRPFKPDTDTQQRREGAPQFSGTACAFVRSPSGCNKATSCHNTHAPPRPPNS